MSNASPLNDFVTVVLVITKVFDVAFEKAKCLCYWECQFSELYFIQHMPVTVDMTMAVFHQAF